MNAKIYKDIEMWDSDGQKRDIQLNNLNWLNRFVVLKTTDKYGVEYLAYEKNYYEYHNHDIVEMFKWSPAYAYGETYKAMKEDIKQLKEY